MPNQKHIDIIRQGFEIWNRWRKENPYERPGFYKANLYNLDLHKTNLRGADLREANLTNANLSYANLFEANIRGACLSKANLYRCDLRKAYIRGANLYGADLTEADLSRSILVNVNLKNANISNCYTYGISAWDIKTDSGTKQMNLVITPKNTHIITVDSLEVAQFVYLLLNNKKIREVIETVSSKAVLILGRFTSERKVVLDLIREDLRKRNYMPMMFDFDKPISRDTKETILTLASISRFIIADLTDAKSIPLELSTIVPNLPSVLVQPLIQSGSQTWGMYDSIKHYPWVLDIIDYDLYKQSIDSIVLNAISRVEEKLRESRGVIL